MRLSISDVGLKIAALLMACAFALHVRPLSGDVHMIRVSITVTHVPAGFEARVSPDSARVHIRATDRDFRRLLISPPVIRLESGQSHGAIRLSSRNILFGPGPFPGVVEQIEPAEVYIEIVPASGDTVTTRNP